MIRVLFFANLRDYAGVDSIELSADGIRSVRDLLSAFKGVLPEALIDALSDESAMVSVDHKYAAWDAPLHDGAEVGLLPPVSGG